MDTTEAATGPTQLALLAWVARRHYLHGRSKVQIAEELAISRFRVARLLEMAMSQGLVKIEIIEPGYLDVEATVRLKETFGLQHALVIRSSVADGTEQRTALGGAAARLLTEIVTPDDVLGLSWSRAISSMAGQVTGLASVPVVQLTGSLTGVGFDDSTVELVRVLSRMSGGPAYPYYAPMVLPDAETVRALRRQPEVARAFDRFASVTKAVVSIGRWRAGESMLFDAVGPTEREQARDAGVLAEVSSVLLTEHGEIVDAPVSKRLVAIGGEQLKALPEVIGLAYGDGKAPAVRAALEGGLVTSLVTHSSLAHALLAKP